MFAKTLVAAGALAAASTALAAPQVAVQCINGNYATMHEQHFVVTDDVDGSPIADTEITYKHSNGEEGTATTDAAGIFFIEFPVNRDSIPEFNLAVTVDGAEAAVDVVMDDATRCYSIVGTCDAASAAAVMGSVWSITADYIGGETPIAYYSLEYLSDPGTQPNPLPFASPFAGSNVYIQETVDVTPFDVTEVLIAFPPLFYNYLEVNMRGSRTTSPGCQVIPGAPPSPNEPANPSRFARTNQGAVEDNSSSSYNNFAVAGVSVVGTLAAVGIVAGAYKVHQKRSSTDEPLLEEA